METKTCAVCRQSFDQFFLYSMHIEGHKVSTEDYGHKQPEIVAKHRNIRGVTHPVSDARRAMLVMRGEDRLGNKHFIG